MTGRRLWKRWTVWRMVVEYTIALDSRVRMDFMAIRIAIKWEIARDALELLKGQETIVRCISCTFYRSDGQCALHDGKWKPEGFCSWAIRKEGR